jgi:light-regulated signal transduction histidine kinase (bacteriophytochrome)
MPPDQPPVHVPGLSEDVTERRQAEQNQRELAEALERKSRELESANKELESFSYSVSHDLRAPLRAIEGYAAILEEDYGAKLDDEGRRFLRNVREGATRMGLLIQGLLAFSRLSRQPLTPAEIDTRLLVQGAWNAIRAAQPQLRAELIVTDLPPSWGDAQLLQQAWTQLLENAVKYSSKVSEPRIAVSGEIDGREARFHIQDNGAGFDMRYYDKLFNVFQRLHSESEFAGTGIGLAVVQRIIARHGGRVWARSELHKGATFSLALPFKPGM